MLQAILTVWGMARLGKPEAQKVAHRGKREAQEAPMAMTAMVWQLLIMLSGTKQSMSKRAALACVLFSLMPIESSLADTELKTFRPGDTIRSSEINRNFSNLDEKDEALEDKIDGNYNTLDNRVATLESSNNSSGGSGGSAAASTLTGYDALDNFQYQYKNIDIGESPPSGVGQKYELVRYDVVSFLTHREIQVSLPAAKFTDDQ